MGLSIFFSNKENESDMEYSFPQLALLGAYSRTNVFWELEMQQLKKIKPLVSDSSYCSKCKEMINKKMHVSHIFI